jgi:antirestriction protein ArdC
MSATKSRSRKSKADKRDIQQEVTDRIIAALEEGIVPWHKPWRSATGERHINFASKKAYRGINVFLLDITAMTQGYSLPYWLTFKQAQAKGGCVRPGEKGTTITFWKQLPIEVDDEKTGEKKKKFIPFLRHYTVFNVEQCDGIELPEVPEVAPFNPIERCEEIVKGMPNAPKLVHVEQRAYYMPSADIINLPKPESFDSPEAYYGTDFHERVHSTGHESRLNRKFGDSFGDDAYSDEELTAEMGSAILCAMVGIDTKPLQVNTAAYIKHWLGKLGSDKKLVVTAASRAQKAVDHILDTKFEEEKAA